MANLSRFRSGRFDRYQSSPEVLAAIEEVAGCDLPEDGADDDEENEAARIWGDPTEAEDRAVVAAAWRLADADENVLFWGVSKLTRRP